MKQPRRQLADEIAEILLKRIADGEFQPGMKIPNEFELADELNVGRGTIREAVKSLVTRNVLVIKRGNGTYVAEHPGRVDDPLGFALNKDKLRLANDLCEVRLILEPEIAALAAERATDEEIVKIREYCDEAAEAIKAGRYHGDADINFHKAIAAASHNQVMASVVPVIQQGVFLFVEIADKYQLEMTVKTHRQICKAIATRDARAAYKYMREHLLKNQITFRIKTGETEERQ